MRWIKWLSILAAVALLVCCFQPWIRIESRQILVSGMSSAGTSFGKPGAMHLVWGSLFILLALIPRVWAVRWNLAVVALNLAWALRNFFLLTACQGGECPEKLPAFYLVLLSCVLMLAGALFSDLGPVPRAPEETPVGDGYPIQPGSKPVTAQSPSPSNPADGSGALSRPEDRPGSDSQTAG